MSAVISKLRVRAPVVRTSSHDGVVIQKRRDGEGKAIPGVPGGIEKEGKRHQHEGPKGIVARRAAIKQAGNQRKQEKCRFNESHKPLPEEVLR